MKKITSMLLVLVLLTGIVFAGGGSDTADDGTVVLRVNMDASPIFTPDVFELFEEKHPDIKIELDQPGDVQAHYTKMMSLIAANDLPDVITSQSAGYVNYVDQGIIADMSPWLETPSYEGDEKWIDTFIPALLDNGRSILTNSTLDLDSYDYGVTPMMTSIAILYNKAIFEEVGITEPKDWDEFYANNLKLKEAGYLPLQILSSDCIDWFPRLFWDQYVREVLDADPLAFENGKIDFYDARVQQGLVEYKKMYDEGILDESIFVNTGLQNQIAFIQGKVAQYFTVPEQLTYIEANKPEGFEIGSFPLPGIAGLPPRSLGGASILFSISTTTKHPEEAALLIKFLTSASLNGEHSNFRFVPSALNKSEKSDELKQMLTAFTDSAKNGFSPEIYVPAGVNAEIAEAFKFDLIPNYLNGSYDIDYVSETLQDLYQTTYLDKKAK